MSFTSRPLCLFLFLLVVLDAPFTGRALRLDLRGQIGTSSRSRSLIRRGNIAGTIPIDDISDIRYMVNITLGGALFNVQIDTGSSDLWVAADSVSQSQSSGKNASVQYAIGEVQGPVTTAPLEFAGYTVPQQAFILATPDATHPASQGLIGLGPNSASNVFSAVGDSTGDTVLESIFRQNQSAPTFITIELGRSADPSVPFPGDLTIGETLPNRTSILSQPQLPVSILSASESGNQHWQALLDADGIIGPDGQVIPAQSQVAGSSNTSQLNVVFDTGFTLPQVPKSVADAIYGRVQGALFTNVSTVGMAWTIPCEQMLNITFKFGGRSFPVHPLDTSLDFVNLTDSDGSSACLGSFQPITSEAQSSTYDMILGMAFLRNAYLLVNFGDLADSSSSPTSGGTSAYIQLLSTTNVNEAHQEFVATRLNGTDTTGDASQQLLPAPLPTPVATGSKGQSSTGIDDNASASPKSTASSSAPSASPNSATSSSESMLTRVVDFVKKYWPYVAAGAGLLIILIISLVLVCCYVQTRRRRRRMEFMQLP